MGFLKHSDNDTHRLPAATLVETMIAMVIVMVCLGIGGLVYLSLLKSNNDHLQHSAGLAVEQVARITHRQKAYVDETIAWKPFSIQKSVRPFESGEQLVVLTLRASNDQGRILSERKELVLVP